VPDAEIGKPLRTIVADGNITGDIDHVVVDALVPAQVRGWYEVAIGDQ